MIWLFRNLNYDLTINFPLVLCGYQRCDIFRNVPAVDLRHGTGQSGCQERNERFFFCGRSVMPGISRLRKRLYFSGYGRKHQDYSEHCVQLFIVCMIQFRVKNFNTHLALFVCYITSNEYCAETGLYGQADQQNPQCDLQHI